MSIGRRLRALGARWRGAAASAFAGGERFDALARLSTDWYFETDAALRFTRFVSAGHHPGAPDGTLLGRRWDALPGVDADGARQAELRSLLERGRPFQDFRFCWYGAGRLHHVLLSGEPVRGRRGALRGWRGVGRDVTAQMEAENALNASESQLAAVIDSAMDAIITIDTAHRAVVFNASAGAMFGVPRAQALGSPIERFLPQGLHAVQAARSTHGATAQVRGLRAGGEEFPVEAAVSRIEVDGQFLYSLTLRDLTERQALERVRAALEVQLRESQKMEALGTMAGGIAHDFNNIVAAILGNAALARASTAQEAAAQVFLAEIDKAGMRARDLVQRIMAFSRRQPSVFTCQPLQPLVHEAVQLLRATLPSGIEIALRMPAVPLHVKADATQISQVLMNLCTNACQAMGGRPGRITVSLHPDACRQLRLEVRDNGCGMDAATVQRIFEPFFTTKPKGEGTGLGLPVVHGIVCAHGGHIDVQSTKGEGTVFCVYLPLADTPDDCATALPLPEAAPAHGTGQHVVYLDDYPAMVFMVQATLAARGYRVTGFEDAQAALDFLRENADDVDLVVSDCNMPVKSGLDVAREVLRMRPQMPVILATGYLTDELRDGARRIGVRHLFDKPRGIEEMCALVGEVLHRPLRTQDEHIQHA